ncbi:Cytoplasmic protein, partial [Monkeypox virus]
MEGSKRKHDSRRLQEQEQPRPRTP